MLAVSEKFLQALKTKQPQDIRLEFTGGDVITGADIAATSGGLTLTEILNSATDVEFGRAVMSELSAVLINADGRFADFDFSREFTAKVSCRTVPKSANVIASSVRWIGFYDAEDNYRQYISGNTIVNYRYTNTATSTDYTITLADGVDRPFVVVLGQTVYIYDVSCRIVRVLQISAQGGHIDITSAYTGLPEYITFAQLREWANQNLSVQAEPVEDVWEEILLGVFKGERPEKVRGKLIEFAAHDRMALFDKSAESFTDGLTFPCTLGEIFTNLCAFCGVGYVSAVFPNSGKTFETNPLEGTDYTCREILGYIAEAAGAYARMSRDGAVELVWFAAADYTVERTDRFEMTESEFLTPPIDKLEVYNSYGDQLNTSGTGDIVYGISDNPFLYIENDTQLEGLQPYVNAIYNRLTSLPAYHPSSFRAEFNPAVQCGDVISVVDDYGETITFPVFVQTITWNGFGKATYENTGGVIRQNAPFTQRELEQIKKKSLRAVDLYTTIDSYLSTEDGKAAIEIAVGGMFITQDDLDGYAKTTEVETKITQEVNNGIAALTLSAEEKTVTEHVPTDEVVGAYENYIPEYIGEYSFEFTDGYFTSLNKGVDSSFAIGIIEFAFTEETVVALECINYAEENYDYGMIGNIDVALTKSNTADSADKLFYSFYGKSSPDVVTLYLTVPAGNHRIEVKFVKDGSSFDHNDCFKIRAVATETKTTSSGSSITLTAGGVKISSTDITFTGYVTFESLSTPGATVIDGANVKTDNLYIQNVFLGGDNSRKIITSSLGTSGGRVDIGFIENYGASSYGKEVMIYADYLYIVPPGGSRTDDNVLTISTKDMYFGANSADWTFDI